MPSDKLMHRVQNEIPYFDYSSNHMYGNNMLYQRQYPFKQAEAEWEFCVFPNAGVSISTAYWCIQRGYN